jgi:hypothetical protein
LVALDRKDGTEDTIRRAQRKGTRSRSFKRKRPSSSCTRTATGPDDDTPPTAMTTCEALRRLAHAEFPLGEVPGQPFGIYHRGDISEKPGGHCRAPREAPNRRRFGRRRVEHALPADPSKPAAEASCRPIRSLTASGLCLTDGLHHPQIPSLGCDDPMPHQPLPSIGGRLY